MRDAYSILSDAEQRQVYDDVFEREMRRWEAEHAAEEAREREAQEAERRLAQAHYEKMVAVAMRFADEGHGRDVLYGVLLGRECEAGLAGRIADSVWALQQSRRTVEEVPDTAAAQDPDSAREPATSPLGAFEHFWHGLFRFR